MDIDKLLLTTTPLNFFSTFSNRFFLKKFGGGWLVGYTSAVKARTERNTELLVVNLRSSILFGVIVIFIVPLFILKHVSAQVCKIMKQNPLAKDCSMGFLSNRR